MLKKIISREKFLLHFIMFIKINHKEIMGASYMSVCHIQGPKLQLKCSEDLMCLFKCGLFCVKY